MIAEAGSDKSLGNLSTFITFLKETLELFSGLSGNVSFLKEILFSSLLLFFLEEFDGSTPSLI